MLSPAERSANARIAANTRAALYDGREVTKKANNAFFARFEKMVDPDNQLSHEERVRRATALRKAHMQRLAKASAKARARKAAQKNNTDTQDQ